MRPVIFAVICFVVAGLLSAFGPYADVRARMTPRPPLEERPAADAAEMREVLGALGPEGRAVYRRHLRWDFLIIAANTGWLWTWLRAMCRRVGRQRFWRWAPAILTTLPATADLAENAALALLLRDFPDATPLTAALAAWATRLKFALFAAAVCSAMVFTTVVALKAVRAQARSKEC